MVHLQPCAVLVAFALLLVVNDASSAAPWSNVFKFPNLRTGSQASNALTFPAFVNNTLMLQLSTDVSSGFSYTLCLNRFAPPAAPIDLATGQVSFRGWTQTCALFMDSITTSQATKNLTFVATGWHYLAVFVNRAPSSGFMITVSATGSSCSLGTYSPDCTKPKLLPLYNLVLEPGEQMLVELPPVAPEQTLMLFTLTYSNGSPSGGVIMSLTNGNTPSATTKYYNFTGSTISGLAQSNPRSCNDPSCTYFGMIGNSANARGPAYLSSLTSAFGSDPMPPIMSVDKGEALTLIVSFSNITLNLQRYYQFGSSSDLSVGVMAWPPVAGAAVPSAILGFGSLPDSVSLGSPGNVAMIGSSAAAANTSLYYSVNGLSSNGVWYVGLNVTEFASPSARAVVWFNAICPSNCHGRNGVCNPQTHICSCAKGFGGPDCSATLNGDDEQQQQQEEEEEPLYASRERVSSRPSRAAMMKYPDVMVVSYDGPE